MPKVLFIVRCWLETSNENKPKKQQEQLLKAEGLQVFQVFPGFNIFNPGRILKIPINSLYYSSLKIN